MKCFIVELKNFKSRKLTGSQCDDFQIGVMCSLCLLLVSTRRSESLVTGIRFLGQSRYERNTKVSASGYKHIRAVVSLCERGVAGLKHSFRLY